jgi:hypothetical protein
VGSGDLGSRGLRLAVKKEFRIRANRRCGGVVRNALAVDAAPSTTENPSPWAKLRLAVGSANQTLRNVVKLNHWVVRDYQNLVDAVNSLENYTRSLSDVQLREKTTEFQDRLKNGKLIPSISPA